MCFTYSHLHYHANARDFFWVFSYVVRDPVMRVPLRNPEDQARE